MTEIKIEIPKSYSLPKYGLYVSKKVNKLKNMDGYSDPKRFGYSKNIQSDINMTQDQRYRHNYWDNSVIYTATEQDYLIIDMMLREYIFGVEKVEVIK